MFTGKKLSTVLLAIFLVVAYIEVTESLPRMRHHRNDSGCTRCSPGWGVINHCTKEHDTTCGKCPPGTYSPHHNLQPCWICSRCGPGLYEAHPCANGRTDTVCDSCHRTAYENPDYRIKCKDHGTEIFLAPEDAMSTNSKSSFVSDNSEDSRVSDYQREIILEKNAEARSFDSTRNSFSQTVN